MAERRSLGQAINITPEKIAFIQGQDKKDTPKVVQQPVASSSDAQTSSAEPDTLSEPRERSQCNGLTKLDHLIVCSLAFCEAAARRSLNEQEASSFHSRV
jgi:hypothetical protein